MVCSFFHSAAGISEYSFISLKEWQYTSVKWINLKTNFFFPPNKMRSDWSVAVLLFTSGAVLHFETRAALYVIGEAISFKYTTGNVCLVDSSLFSGRLDLFYTSRRNNLHHSVASAWKTNGSTGTNKASRTRCTAISFRFFNLWRDWTFLNEWSLDSLLFCSFKDGLELRYKLHSSRDVEVLASGVTSLADGRLHTVSIGRRADAVSVQVNAELICYNQFIIVSNKAAALVRQNTWYREKSVSLLIKTCRLHLVMVGSRTADETCIQGQGIMVILLLFNGVLP